MLGVGSWTVFDHLFVAEALPEPGGTVRLTSPISQVERVYWGGCSLNAAVAARNLGFRSGVLMVCGEDFVDRGYWDYLAKLDMDMTGISVVPGARSGHSFIFSDPEGNSICLSHIGISQEEHPQLLQGDLIERSRSLLVSYQFDRVGLHAAKRARELDRLVGLNGALVTSPEIAREFVREADVLFNNKSEMARLLDLLEASAPEALFDEGLTAIFVTEGADGCRILTPDTCRRIPAVPPRAIVDTTGAGDAFAGTAMTAIARGMPLEIAARLASVVSSCVVEARGCQTNLPNLDQARNRYFEHFGEELPALAG